MSEVKQQCNCSPPCTASMWLPQELAGEGAAPLLSRDSAERALMARLRRGGGPLGRGRAGFAPASSKGPSTFELAGLTGSNASSLPSSCQPLATPASALPAPRPLPVLQRPAARLPAVAGALFDGRVWPGLGCAVVWHGVWHGRGMACRTGGEGYVMTPGWLLESVGRRLAARLARDRRPTSVPSRCAACNHPPHPTAWSYSMQRRRGRWAC